MRRGSGHRITGFDRHDEGTYLKKEKSNENITSNMYLIFPPIDGL